MPGIDSYSLDNLSIDGFQDAGNFVAGTTVNIYNMSISQPVRNSTTPVLALRVKMTIGGTIKVYPTFRTGVTGINSYCRIYVNGNPFGTTRSSSNASSSTTYNEDVTIKAGDEIQIYLWNDPGGNPVTLNACAFTVERFYTESSI
ncbi:hypothetical protein M3629_03915 [Paenibacillus polysaccharolyticus]|uniref:hypothetical protein n=1 Tax=Paenibacillus polysaccharolyticus TaxID=582692 RepID=UPI00203ACE45|nr:hypothetical protein [Paenibacillus polysaccharolyticus]MCM3131915.1 hypothetical protein [Paenibacillus polysaccharolyticus]